MQSIEVRWSALALTKNECRVLRWGDQHLHWLKMNAWRHSHSHTQGTLSHPHRTIPKNLMLVTGIENWMDSMGCSKISCMQHTVDRIDPHTHTSTWALELTLTNRSDAPPTGWHNDRTGQKLQQKNMDTSVKTTSVCYHRFSLWSTSASLLPALVQEQMGSISWKREQIWEWTSAANLSLAAASQQEHGFADQTMMLHSWTQLERKC